MEHVSRRAARPTASIDLTLSRCVQDGVCLKDVVCPATSLNIGDIAEREFDSRIDAILYAARRAHKLQMAGRTVAVSLEGADGRWRAFNSSLQPMP